MRGESLEDNNPENRPESSLLSLTICEAKIKAYQTDKTHFIKTLGVEMKGQLRLPFDQSLEILFS